jgi:hypothetical protein
LSRRVSSCAAVGHGVAIVTDIADSVRAEGAVRGTACFADPARFIPLPGHPDCPVWLVYGRASRPAGSAPFCSRWAAGWSCSYPRPGRASGSARAIPSMLHRGGDRVRAARRRVEGWHGAGRCGVVDAPRKMAGNVPVGGGLATAVQ